MRRGICTFFCSLVQVQILRCARDEQDLELLTQPYEL